MATQDPADAATDQGLIVGVAGPIAGW